MLPAISPSLQMSSSATATGGRLDNAVDQLARNEAAGNRGFINNFAAAGAHQSPDVNGPAFNPGMWTWILPLALGAVAAWWIFRRK